MSRGRKTEDYVESDPHGSIKCVDGFHKRVESIGKVRRIERVCSKERETEYDSGLKGISSKRKEQLITNTRLTGLVFRR